jgi:ferric-dicitrate binding protein FerR (iron transport regulator)
MESENRLWKLVALKFSGEASDEELSELEDYLNSFPEKRSIVTCIETYWNQKDDFQNTDDEMEEHRFHLIVNGENREEDFAGVAPGKTGKLRKYKWFYAAASVLIICAVGVLIKTTTQRNSSGKTGIQRVFVKPGSRSQIILPDGSIVRLNGSSGLTYPKDFNKEVRNVYLKGEAYFEVKKDAEHPFVVHTSNIDIKVLGTVFNVKCYEQDETIEATLLRGSIQVYNKTDPSAPKIILKPNEKLVFRKKTDEIPLTQNKVNVDSSVSYRANNEISISALSSTQPDSLKEEISWLYNRLIIDDDSFVKMAEKMERWYGVTIQIMSPELERYHFKGIFQNETIEQALDALRLTASFNYKINNDTIKIMK